MITIRKDGIVAEQILFLHGAGNGAYDEDRRLVNSLVHALGPDFEVRYPAIADDGDASFEQWRRQIDEALDGISGSVVVVGHSVGASVFLKWLSDGQDERDIAGVFLIATPFWGGDGWRYKGYGELELPPGLANRLPADLPIFLYHCRDDTTVPFDHLALYAHVLPLATVCALDDCGHQFDDDLSAVARDIASLPRIG